MKVKEVLIGVLSWLGYLMSASILFLIAVGNFIAIVIVFLLAPLSLLIGFRKLFSEKSQEVVIRFDFSWFDLILYIPGAVLTYFLIVKVVYPFSAFTFWNFVIVFLVCCHSFRRVFEIIQ